MDGRNSLGNTTNVAPSAPLQPTEPSAPDLPDAQPAPMDNPPSYAESQREWLEQLSEEKRQEYFRYVDELKTQEKAAEKAALMEQRRQIHQRHQNLFPAGYSCEGELDPFEVYYLSRLALRLQVEFSQQAITALSKIVPDLLQAGGKVVMTAVHGGAQVVQAVSGGEDCGECGIPIGFAALGIAAVTSALIAATYAAKKIGNSIKNLFNGEKVEKSILRLVSIVTGIIAGGWKGALVGAAIGSACPGVGTAIGAVLGLMLGAGAGALIGKYVGKFASWVRHRNDAVASQTNPEKWTLPEKVQTKIEKQGVNTCSMLTALCAKKNRDGVKASFPCTQARKRKNLYNALLKKIKKDEDLEVTSGEVQVKVNNLFFKWSEKENRWASSYAPFPSAPSQLAMK